MSSVEAYEAELHALLRRFAANVRRLRKGSQSELAEAADLHRTEIGDLEGGHTNPNLHTLLILANALGVTLDQLVHDLPVPSHRRPSPKERAAASARRGASAPR
jgi:transcriptional regulator with XRE-family HTH domain